MTANFKKFIKQIIPISDADFEKSMVNFQEIRLIKGDYLVKENAICRQIAFINKGILRIFYLNNKAEDTTSCFCTQNGFSTSYRSFLLQEPSLLAIQALEDTELLVINFQNLQKLYLETPIWQQVGRIVAEKEYLHMEKYAAILNNETAKEKYLRLLSEQPEIIQKATVEHIASYLGVTRRTLSRIRKEITESAPIQI
jgi:CRP-like cAMP-binding protein